MSWFHILNYKEIYIKPLQITNIYIYNSKLPCNISKKSENMQDCKEENYSILFNCCKVPCCDEVGILPLHSFFIN